MTLGQRLSIALRYTIPSRRGHLSTFLSSLSMLGLVLAIALLIVVLSVMNGFDKEMRERILALVPHISVYSHLPLVETDQPMQTLLAHPEVSDVTPFARFDTLLIRGGEIETAQGIGIAPDAAVVSQRLLGGLDGDALQRFRADRQSVVLGIELARRLGVQPGARVSLVVPSEQGAASTRGARFRAVEVQGVLDSGTELDENLALVPLALASELAGLDGGVSGFRVATSNLFEVQRIAWELTAALPAGYYSTHWMMTHGNLYAAIQLSRDLVVILLFSIIAVAAFNVVSSLVLVVLDKQGNIAILRSLGASSGDIAWIFILQGAMIGLVGVVVGSAVGALAALSVPGIVSGIEGLLGIRFLNTDVYPVSFLPVDLRLKDVVTIAMVALVMCVLAAIYPARRAAQQAPAVALSQEH